MSDIWKDYVLQVISVIDEYRDSQHANIAVVGIYGSKLRKRAYRLRVYVNGGKAMEIPLNPRGDFSFAISYLDQKDENGEWKYFSAEDHDKIEEFIDEAKTDNYRWKRDNFESLRTYLSLIEKATSLKFGKLAGSLGDEEKERCRQVALYNDLRKSKGLGDLLLFDMEFQSILEMNYTQTERDEMRKKGGIRKAHCGKPDYLAVSSKGFSLVELKTNEAALTGLAGLENHHRDLDRMIRINKRNHVLVRELVERLSYAREYGLVEGSQVDKILAVPEKDVKRIEIGKTFIFQTNANLSRERCEDYISKMHIEGISIIL
ncbi:MAG: hypothetical protein K5989_07620 [Lachnospiraceae bacterium]|nr:hypothetical protein [Lachnospiraceae bacterium]